MIRCAASVACGSWSLFLGYQNPANKGFRHKTVVLHKLAAWRFFVILGAARKKRGSYFAFGEVCEVEQYDWMREKHVFDLLKLKVMKV